MNARDNTPLRTLIANRLSAGEDTAVGIARAIGKGDTPSIVVKELNAMRTDGQVECEQRGKKKELVYWLAVPLAVAAESEPAPAPAAISEGVLPDGIRHGTRAAQIYRALPAFGAEPVTARQIATATGAALGLISPTISGMVKARQISRVDSGVGEAYGYTRLPAVGGDSEGGDIDIQNAQPEVAKNTGSSVSGSLSPSEGAAVQPEPAPVAADTPAAAPAAADETQDDDEMPPANASLLALANRELADRLARVAHVLRGSGLPGLKGLDDGEDLQVAASALTGAYQVALREIDDANLRASVAAENLLRLQAELDGRSRTVKVLVNKLGEERTARQSLQEQIEHLQREAMRGATCLSGKDRYTAAGYLVRAPKRPLRTFSKAESARAAAMAAARNGSGRGEVFALVPAGKAVRGAEWRPA